MNRKHRIAGIAALFALTAGGGMAYAAWSTSGTGTGRAAAITATTLTVTAATGAADLYPGFADGDVHFTVTNPNPYPVTIASMSPGAITTSTPGCLASMITVDPATGLSIAVGANATTSAVSIADVVTMSAAAPDACQGATFQITLTLTGTQV